MDLSSPLKLGKLELPMIELIMSKILFAYRESSPTKHLQDMSMLSRMGKHISKSQTGHICVPTSWKEKEVSPWSQFCTLLFAREWVTLGVHNKLDLPKNHVQSSTIK